MKICLQFPRNLSILTATLVLSACGGSTGDIALSGTATGVTASGVILANVVNTVVMPITIPVNATTFAFPRRVQVGVTYTIIVQTEPVNLSCTVANPVGTAPTTDVTGLELTCQPRNVLGGTVNGLTGTGLVLANGPDVVSVAANATTFSFANRVTFASAYGVTILTQPAGQTCAVTTGSGTMGAADITNVQVSCS